MGLIPTVMRTWARSGDFWKSCAALSVGGLSGAVVLVGAMSGYAGVIVGNAPLSPPQWLGAGFCVDFIQRLLQLFLGLTNG